MHTLQEGFELRKIKDLWDSTWHARIDNLGIQNGKNFGGIDTLTWGQGVAPQI
jgi:hypothetical protein